MTTNGSLLARKARALRDAGLRRVTVSLDSLDDGVFRAMNDVGFPVARVLEGIDAACAAGLAPVKVNCVVERGTNDAQVLPLVEHFRGSGVTLRFIEYMDVEGPRGWSQSRVVPSGEIRAMVERAHALLPVARRDAETASNYLLADGSLARSDLLMQIQADLLGVAVERPEQSEPAALGIAYLAARGANIPIDASFLERGHGPAQRSTERTMQQAGYPK